MKINWPVEQFDVGFVDTSSFIGSVIIGGVTVDVVVIADGFVDVVVVVVVVSCGNIGGVVIDVVVIEGGVVVVVVGVASCVDGISSTRVDNSYGVINASVRVLSTESSILKW